MSPLPSCPVNTGMMQCIGEQNRRKVSSCARTARLFELVCELFWLTFRAISCTSRVSQPSVSAKVAASVSLPNRMSTYGSVSSSVCLNGGTCTRTERFRMVFEIQKP